MYVCMYVCIFKKHAGCFLQTGFWDTKVEADCNIPYVLKNQNSLYFKKELQLEEFILILPTQIEDYKAST